jgi:poly(3-hydroxybutyrate) depolymerase
LLEHTYGALNPPSRKLSGRFIEFDQREFLDGDAYSHSMRNSGFAYIPASCASTRCRVHVALHGCLQHFDAVGDEFYKKAGYNEWADANNIIVLYPQTIARFGWNWKVFWTLKYVVNPNACWDWWGYDGADYHTKNGSQMKAIKKMVNRLGSMTKG